jgi:D-alanine-D-alanine ligase
MKLNCSGVGYVDMIVDKITNVPYILEIGTIPGYTNISKVPFSASLQRISIKKLLEVSVQIALNKNTDLNKIFRNVE